MPSCHESPQAAWPCSSTACTCSSQLFFDAAAPARCCCPACAQNVTDIPRIAAGEPRAVAEGARPLAGCLSWHHLLLRATCRCMPRLPLQGSHP